MKDARVARLLGIALSFALARIAAGQTSLLDILNRPAPPPSRGPATYGTAPTSYLSVFESQFVPFNSSVTYDDLGNGDSFASRYGIGGIKAFFAGVNLPNGALLASVELDVCDSNGSGNHVVGVMAQCDIVGTNCSGVGLPMQSVSNAGAPCAQIVQDLSGLSYTVNNLTGRLFLLAITNAGDNTNSISGALVGYKLQVSPAPATADFTDVPTSHPFFQFVEALYQSGITAGCGGGNFCPDSPLTRGQMAVFLAKALGLQFP